MNIITVTEVPSESRTIIVEGANLTVGQPVSWKSAMWTFYSEVTEILENGQAIVCGTTVSSLRAYKAAVAEFGSLTARQTDIKRRLANETASRADGTFRYTAEMAQQDLVEQNIADGNGFGR